MIYHLATEKDWDAALGRGTYKVASLSTEGFIHCSTKEQVMESARLHFGGDDRVIVLHIAEKPLKDFLKWEPSRAGDLFPHVYGPIPLEAIEDLHFLSRDQHGDWIAL